MIVARVIAWACDNPFAMGMLFMTLVFAVMQEVRNRFDTR